MHDDPNDPRDAQPPIENDQQLAGYREGLARFDAIVTGYEEDLFASRDDPTALETARRALYRVYKRRQAMLDAIGAYERQQSQQSQTAPSRTA